MTPEQCRAARAMLGISQDDLSGKTAVSKRTIAGFEMGQSHPYPRTLEAIRQVLEDEGIEFIPENGGGVGVRLKKP